MDTQQRHITESDLVSFGQYLLSKARRDRIKGVKGGLPASELAKQVSDADIQNWKAARQ